MNLLLISGGRHPYHETTPILKECIEKAGHKVTLSDSADELAGGLAGFDAIVLNTRRDKEAGNDLTTAKREGLRSFVNNGGGLVSIHISPASCPDCCSAFPLFCCACSSPIATVIPGVTPCLCATPSKSRSTPPGV